MTMPFRRYLSTLLWVIVSTLKGYAQTPVEKASALPPTVEALRAEIEAVKPGELPFDNFDALCNRVYQSGNAELFTLCCRVREVSLREDEAKLRGIGIPKRSLGTR